MNDRPAIGSAFPDSSCLEAASPSSSADTLCSSLDRAVLRALAYAGLFGGVLTRQELLRYAVGVRASGEGIEQVIAESGFLKARVGSTGAYFHLGREAGRTEARTRLERESAEAMSSARFLGGLISSMPLVRMVALTGSAAAGTCGCGEDLDFLVVTEPGRLWICRMIVVALCRAIGMVRPKPCPNFFLSEDSLALGPRNIFTANEIARMVPLHGFDVYRKLRAANEWVADFLPNASGPPGGTEPRRGAGIFRLPILPVEGILRLKAAQIVEKFESRRKISRFSSRGCPDGEFGPGVCKAHFGSLGSRIPGLYLKTLESIGRLCGHVPCRGCCALALNIPRAASTIPLRRDP